MIIGFDKSLCTKTIWHEHFLGRTPEIGVDVRRFPARMIVPRKTGLLHFGVRSTYILGLQIGSILSRLPTVALAERSMAIKIEFFCRLECTEGLVL